MTFESRRRPAILHMMSMRSTKLGGLEEYLLEVIRLCADRGYRSIVQYEELPRSEEYLSQLQSAEVQLVVTPVLSKRSEPARSLVNTWQLINHTRPVILQTHFTDRLVSLVAPVAARRVGARKALALIHSNLSWATTGFSWEIRKRLLRACVERYDTVLLVADHIRKSYLAAGANAQKLVTHHLGLFGERERTAAMRSAFRSEFGIPDNASVFAIIAFDIPFKGLDILLPAFEQATRPRNDVHLIIIGIDPQQSSLFQLSTSLGVGERVHWAGIRDRGWQVLCAADIYVQSSRFGEGLNLSTLEAMALGLPVLATKVSGMEGEAVVEGETGFLCEAGSIDSLANGIDRMLREVSSWPAMGDAGRRRFVRLFRGDASARRLVEEHYEL